VYSTGRVFRDQASVRPARPLAKARLGGREILDGEDGGVEERDVVGVLPAGRYAPENVAELRYVDTRDEPSLDCARRLAP